MARPLAPPRVLPKLVAVALTLALPGGARPQAMPDAGSGGPETILVLPGERVRLCTGGTCHSPMCDDPSIAVISADGMGLLEGRRPGTTTCSVDTGLGLRRIVAVTVAPPPPPAPAAPPMTTPAIQRPPGEGEAPRRTPARAAPQEEEAIYVWTEPDGSVRYGRESDIPERQRGKARLVTPGRAPQPPPRP